MKNLINSLAILVLAIIGMTTFSSCDPCTSVVCPAHSVCKTGSCACDSGYVKTGAKCDAANLAYISVDSSVSATVLSVDSSAATNTSTGVAYTVIPSSTNPYTFTLKNFGGISANDITFTISSTNFDVLSAQTVTTAASKTYMILSGGKTGSQVSLVIKETPINTTYTITYS